MKLLALACLLLALAGCDNKAQQDVARQQGRNEFRARIAAVKVATDGASCDEFHAAVVAAKISFEANRPYLSELESNFSLLIELSDLCDYSWHQTLNPYSGPLNPRNARDSQVLFCIFPSIKTNAHYFSQDSQVRATDYHFNRHSATETLLAEIAGNCDFELAHLR